MTSRLAVVIHDLPQARAALALETTHGVAVTLHTARGAARYAGVGFFTSLEVALGRRIVVDCGEDAGLVMAGLRAGLRQLVYTGGADTLVLLADMAGQLGGAVTALPELPSLQLEPGENPARAVKRVCQ